MASASALPDGFQVKPLWTNINQPTAVCFAPDGRVFMAEKLGYIRTFDSINDPSSVTVADLSNRVWSFHDHGLLGLEVDPQFPSRPYLYVLYSLRGAPGGRLSRLTINTSTFQMTGQETVLIQDWAQVYPSHSIGDLNFGPEGALYLTAGDGASFNFVEWGQDEPFNPDGSPLGGIDIPDPVNEGGALRSQDIRSTGDPLGLSGTLVRVNPDTGAAWPGNPLAGGSTSDDRILAYGLRNPFRFAINNATGHVWICDVGWNTWEELNRVPFPFTSPVPNFGWPAYEGVGRQPGYDGANLPLLESLYAEGTATPPFYTYQHVGGAAITGAEFYMGGDYPPQYDGALFLGDHARGDLRVMFPDANGHPNPNSILTFIPNGLSVVDIQVGPGGDIFFIDIDTGEIRQIEYTQGNNPPTAVIQASVYSGNAPLLVNFSGAQSSDPDAGDSLTYSWDLNGDGTFGDSTAIAPSYTYTQSGTFSAKLRVTDESGVSDTATANISVDNRPPVPEILTPSVSLNWRTNDIIQYSGRAIDPETGEMPASQLSWEVILHHCADIAFTDCHNHRTHEAVGVDAGAFIAIDHEYPCYLEIRLTATEPGANGASATTSLELFPDLTTVTLLTNPPGLEVGMFSVTGPAPLVKEGIVSGVTAVSATSPQTLNGQTYVFSSWTDGGAQSHGVTLTDAPMTLTANFVPATTGTNNPPVFQTIWDRSVSAGNGVGFYIQCSDPDGTIPEVSGVNLPANANLFDHYGDGSRYFEWYTQPEDAGTHVISLIATDNGTPPMSTTVSFVINVLDDNQPPSMDGVWDTQVDAGDFVELRIGAWDTDGDIPDLFAENLPPGSAYEEDGWGTGFFTWQTNLGDVGVYSGIRVYAVDHGEPPMTSQRIFSLTVLGSPDAPVIERIPSTSVLAGETLSLNVYASDPNGTIPVLTAQGLPEGATFTANGDGTGVFTWPTTADDAGNHSGLMILATDSATPALKYKAMFNVLVVSDGDAPVLNPIGPKAVTEESLLQFTVSATDADGPPPSLGVDNLPLGATFIDHGNGTGTFTWTPEHGAHENSPYTVTFEASDAAHTDRETISITVESSNSPPHLEDVGSKAGVESELLEFFVHAHDHDGTIPT
ncbi:MAG TPA: PQQ-dependent sugar dehydrogenase, partial [Candidatus Hydrogenedentes bacterium]|nr:PQQ-dependent sugar dehydrogenase [Candidatus Hydrogenedentota bacterium]